MIIFVDFDHTLCLHTRGIDSRLFIDENSDPYKYSVPNDILINYLQKKKNEGNDIILLSAASSFMITHKKAWCNKYAKDIIGEFVGVSIDCTKLDYISSFAHLHNVDASQCMLIDDNYKETEAAENYNILAYSPQYIMNACCGEDFCI